MKIPRMLAAVSLVLVATAQLPAQAPKSIQSLRSFGGTTFDLNDNHRKAIREWIVTIARDSADRGSSFYNKGAHVHAFFYFQSSLLSISPYLPLIEEEELAERTQSALFRVQDVEENWQAAIILRTAINDIRNRLDKDENGNERPLWFRLGEEEGVEAIVKMAFDRMAANKAVNFTRNGEYPYEGGRPGRLVEAGTELIREISNLAEKEPKKPKRSTSRQRSSTTTGQPPAQPTAAGQPTTPAPTQTPSAGQPSTSGQPSATGQAAPAGQAQSGQAAETLVVNPKNQKIVTDRARSMEAIHAGMRITSSEYRAAKKEILKALEYNCVPEQETNELINRLEAYKSVIVGK